MKCIDNKPASQYYQFLDKLGEGSFGYIWKVLQKSTGQIYACKLVKNSMKKEKTLLSREIKILQLLKGKKGFPQFIQSGQDNKNTYFVMSLLGDNLEQTRIKYGNFDTTTILNTGLQMVTLLRDLHNTNIIHRDIKPENFVVHENKIHLIDFGLSKLYIQDNKHIEYRENKGMIGIARYASINSLKGNEQSRRDDLESVGYLLIYLYMGALPWNNIVTEDKQLKYYRIQRMKEAFKPENYVNLPLEISKYLEYVKRLQFEQKPDYVYLENLFRGQENLLKSPKLQIQHLATNKSHIMSLKSTDRSKCHTSRPSLHQIENTSRRVTFEELSSAGADITEEHEGIKLQNLSVGIKQPRINKGRTGSEQIFEIENTLKFHQLPISLKQLQ